MPVVGPKHSLRARTFRVEQRADIGCHAPIAEAPALGPAQAFVVHRVDAHKLIEHDRALARQLPFGLAGAADPVGALGRKGVNNGRELRRGLVAHDRRHEAQVVSRIGRGERRDILLAYRRQVRCDPFQKGEKVHSRGRAALHVETVELHLARARDIPGAHPFDELDHLFGVPGPETHAGDDVERIALAVEHIVVNRKRRAILGLEADHGEAELRHAVLDHPMLELEELAGAVGRLTERDDPRLTNQGAQLLEILEVRTRLGAGERKRIGLEPADDGIAGMAGPLGTNGQRGPCDTRCAHQRAGAQQHGPTIEHETLRHLGEEPRASRARFVLYV